MKRILFATSALVCLAACGPDATLSEAEPIESSASSFEPRPIKTEARDDWGTFGLDLASLNETIPPGDNFFQYMNGGWIDTFDMPADRSRYGAFSILREKSEQRVRNIIDELAAAAPQTDTLEGKIAAVYNAFMDVGAIEMAGLAPAQPHLDRIQAISSYEDLARLFGSSGYSSPVGGFVDIDSKQTDRYIFQLTQSGLGLPDRDYYLLDNERNEALRAAYRDYLTILLTEAGYEDVGDVADSIIALETRIAAEHWDRTVGRNRNLTYNKVTRDELLAIGAGFP
ncbi:MAG: M13 family metallopeptidase N-terminal domain-containing protein, partial [Pseudomonadota bacterium]